MRPLLNRFTKNPAIIYTLLLFSFFFIGYILPLGERALFVPDETRYAEIPREMIASGDWGVPHLNGLRYFEKPPLGYWLNATSIVLFGKNAFAVRLPSALAAGLTALMVFVLVGRVLQRQSCECEDTPILAEHVWGDDFDPFNMSNFMDVHIKNLRHKIGDTGGGIIRTLRGVGYMVEDPKE